MLAKCKAQEAPRGDIYVHEAQQTGLVKRLRRPLSAPARPSPALYSQVSLAQVPERQSL